MRHINLLDNYTIYLLIKDRMSIEYREKNLNRAELIKIKLTINLGVLL